MPVPKEEASALPAASAAAAAAAILVFSGFWLEIP